MLFLSSVLVTELADTFRKIYLAKMMVNAESHHPNLLDNLLCDHTFSKTKKRFFNCLKMSQINVNVSDATWIVHYSVMDIQYQMHTSGRSRTLEYFMPFRNLQIKARMLFREKINLVDC